MNFSTDTNRSDQMSVSINYDEIYSKEIEHHLSNLTEKIDQINKIEINDGGDVIDCPNNNNDDDDSLRKSGDECNENSVTIKPYQWFNLDDTVDEFRNINQAEKIDLKDLNSIDEQSAVRLVLPQSIDNHIYRSNSFEQLWSSRVYSPKLIDSKITENPLSILWSLTILLSKLFVRGFNSCTKILQYDTLFFAFCYILGALFAMNAYFFIDFLLILICVISILVATYEKWLFYYINLNEYDNNNENDIENKKRYWRQIKLAAYGLAIGTISTLIV